MTGQGEIVAPGRSRSGFVLSLAGAFGGARRVLQWVPALLVHPALANTAQTRFDAILVLGFPAEDDGNLGSTSSRARGARGVAPT